MFQVDYRQPFKEKLAKLPAKTERIINDKIQDLRHDPYRGSLVLQDPVFGGKRRFSVGRNRLVYMICKDCLQLGHDKVHQCVDCGPHREDFLLFFALWDRGKGYEKETRRVGKVQTKKLTNFAPKTEAERAKRKASRKGKKPKRKK